MSNIYLEVTEIQRGCTHDGPGLRTVVFLKGCPLRCKWCHNPETQLGRREIYYSHWQCSNCLRCKAACIYGAHHSVDGAHAYNPEKCRGCLRCTEKNVCPTGALEPVSFSMAAEEIMDVVMRDNSFYRSRGGLTVSGGEPAFQSEGLLYLLELASKKNISVCLETSGAFPSNMLPSLISHVDLFLYDIKDTDYERHLRYTGFELAPILARLSELDLSGGQTILRCIMVPEINMNKSHALSLAKIYKSLKNCGGIELLPYHPYGNSKAERLCRQDQWQTIKAKSENNLLFARYIKEQKIPIKLYGSWIYD